MFKYRNITLNKGVSTTTVGIPMNYTDPNKGLSRGREGGSRREPLSQYIIG